MNDFKVEQASIIKCATTQYLVNESLSLVNTSSSTHTDSSDNLTDKQELVRTWSEPPAMPSFCMLKNVPEYVYSKKYILLEAKVFLLGFFAYIFKTVI